VGCVKSSAGSLVRSLEFVGAPGCSAGGVGAVAGAEAVGAVSGVGVGMRGVEG
jgi:hypothetical protein